MQEQRVQWEDSRQREDWDLVAGTSQPAPLPYDMSPHSDQYTNPSPVQAACRDQMPVRPQVIRRRRQLNNTSDTQAQVGSEQPIPYDPSEPFFTSPSGPSYVTQRYSRYQQHPTASPVDHSRSTQWSHTAPVMPHINPRFASAFGLFPMQQADGPSPDGQAMHQPWEPSGL
jgi:hypothetical protein